MEKLPESSVSLDLLSSHTARSGLLSRSLHRVTCSAGSSCCRDGHHRRLVLVDGDRLGKRVLEESSKAFGGDVALLNGVGGTVDTAANIAARTG